MELPLALLITFAITTGCSGSYSVSSSGAAVPPETPEAPLAVIVSGSEALVVDVAAGSPFAGLSLRSPAGACDGACAIEVSRGAVAAAVTLAPGGAGEEMRIRVVKGVMRGELQVGLPRAMTQDLGASFSVSVNEQALEPAAIGRVGGVVTARMQWASALLIVARAQAATAAPVPPAVTPAPVVPPPQTPCRPRSRRYPFLPRRRWPRHHLVFANLKRRRPRPATRRAHRRRLVLLRPNLRSHPFRLLRHRRLLRPTRTVQATLRTPAMPAAVAPSILLPEFRRLHRIPARHSAARSSMSADRTSPVALSFRSAFPV